MKQILQSARTGKLELVEVPAPSPAAGQVLVRTRCSVVSPGTETMSMDFARQSLVGKARSRPDLVRQVVRKLRQEGPLQTYRTVMGRLDAPQPLGYSCAGVVESVGADVRSFAPGDRVACAGAGYANHAEWNVVPENLVARVPDGVSLDRAAYATVGSIALQGLRLVSPQLGEVAAVVGLGLIGQLAVQLLRAGGCRVVGLDTVSERVQQALGQGAEWAFGPGDASEEWRLAATGGHGVDLAIVAASASSSAPISLAADLCRQRGRISIIGAMPMELERRTFYDKELQLQVSMSYGPGRYDRSYEEEGHDYPLPFVRWTENRNMQAFLALLASDAVRPEALETDVVDFAEAEATYESLAKGERRALSIVFRYREDAVAERSLSLANMSPVQRKSTGEEVGIAFLGAGNYAKAVLLPALEREKVVRALTLVTATGASARRTGERFGFARCGTDPEVVLSDPAVDLVFIATQHDSHAELATRALQAGKAVWLEKPVALDAQELETVIDAAREHQGWLTVGYNRRFSSHACAVKDAFSGRQGPMAIDYLIAAGPTPSGTWITDPRVGGGRVVGEVCHFVDLCTFLVGAPPSDVYARFLGRDPERDDSMLALLGFSDGSTAAIHYLAQASSELPKERFEVSADGRSARCENFRRTEIYGGKSHRSVNQDKGQAAAISRVIAALQSGEAAPMALDEIEAVSRTTFAIAESAATGARVEIAP